MLKQWSIILFLLMAGCRDNALKNNATVSTIENEIRTHLPIGSSKSAVIAFLDQKGISHAPLKKGVIGNDGNFAISNTHVERGLIRDVRTNGLIFKTFVSLQMDFRFDTNDLNLINYSVKEIYKGP